MMGGRTATLFWRSGNLAVVTGLTALGAGLFLYYTLYPPDVAAPHHAVRGRWLIETASLFDFDGIGWGFFAVALYLLAYAGLCLWRIVDPIALVASEGGLRLHPSLTAQAIAWQEIAEISVAPQRRGTWSAPVPTLAITFKQPRRLRFSLSEKTQVNFPSIDIGDGIGQRFIACLPIVGGPVGNAALRHDGPAA